MPAKPSGTIEESPLHEENQRLKRAVEELSILNDLARAIGALTNSQEVMQIIIRRSLKAIHAEQGVITLVEEEPNAPMKTLVRTMVSSAVHPHYHFHQSLLGWMQLNKRPLLMNDPASDERFRGVRWDESIRSLLCVPLMVKSQLRGVLTVYNKKDDGKFSEDDQRLLGIIAAQSAQVIENARLYENEQAFQSMKEQLRLAAQIQMDLLPKSSPKVPGYDIAGKTTPAQMVGGDYFDFLQLDDHRLAICLGDVSGKGLPASLLMANLQATLRGQALLGVSPRVCIQRSNRLLYLSTSSDKFATLFYGLLDSGTHQFSYCNAGHENPFVFSSAPEPRRLDEGGVVLSILEEFPYEEGMVQLEAGDCIVIYSDGINEAINTNHEQYGIERLESLIRGHREDSASLLIDHIMQAVHKHSISEPQTDDMTVVVIKRSREPAA